MTYPEYLNKLARKLGFKSYSDYVRHSRKKRGPLTQEQYLQELAEQKGVGSISEYFNLLKKRRSLRPRHQHFAGTLVARLEELNISVAKLSQGTGINRSYIYEYLRGHLCPRRKNLKKIIKALRLDYTIDL